MKLFMWSWLFWKVFTVTTMTWLIGMQYLCHKWSQICSVVGNYIPILSSFMTYHQIFSKSNTAGVTSVAGTKDPLSSPPVFSRVHVVQSVVFCVIFYQSSSFCPFSFGNCFVCSPLNYCFWLPLWYLQTFLGHTGHTLQTFDLIISWLLYFIFSDFQLCSGDILKSYG